MECILKRDINIEKIYFINVISFETNAKRREGDKKVKTVFKVVLALAFVIFVSQANAALFEVAGSGAFNVDTQPATIVSLTSPTSGFITDLNIFLNINAPYVNDLQISLSHNGTSAIVYQGIPTDAGVDSFINATFDDQAVGGYNPVGSVTGTVLPFSSLAAFNGANLAGTWELSILDQTTLRDGNNLIAWNISGDASPVPVPPSVWLFGSGLVGLVGIRRRLGAYLKK